MRDRRLVSVMWAGALVFGVVLGAAPRVLHAADVRGKAKGTGKAGDLCKTDKDCAQKPRPLTCREEDGGSKCYAPPVHPVT